MRTLPLLSTGRPRLLVESVDGVTVVRFADTEIVDENVIGALDQALRELADRLGATPVILNFDEVQHLSSSLLAVLLSFSRRVTRNGGRLKLCSIAGGLGAIFRITQFDRLFEIHDTETLALDSFF
jgi:anti-anti-sigma factor